MNDEQPLLTLELVDASTVPIEIGGVTYRMFNSPMKTVARRLRQFEKYQRRAVELDEKEDLTEAEETELIDCLARGVSLICDAPMDILRRLNDAQLQAIMAGFSMLQAANRQPNGANGQTASPVTTSPSNGAGTSTRSRGSTPGRRRTTGGRRPSKMSSTR